MSLLNWGGGLSAAGSAISSFAEKAGVEQQKSDLEKQQAVLADQLATTRETTLAGVRGEQDRLTGQSNAEATGGQQRQTDSAKNALPMDDAQIAANKVAQQQADAATTHAQAAMLDAKKPIGAGYGNGWLVPDAKSPNGYRVMTAVAPVSDAPLDPNSNNLTAQVGLSDNAIAVATGKLNGRFAAPYRAELQAWGIKTGKNIDTLIPQAQAADAILKTNLERNNQGTILENEIAKTIDNAAALADKVDLSRVNVGNVLAVWAGKQVNDPAAIKVADQLGRLREELAGYNAVAGGHLLATGGPHTTPEDYKNAEATISSGISSGGLKALGQSVAMSAEKNRAVLEQSINDANTSYYKLFGATYHAPEHTAGGTTAPATTAPATTTPNPPKLPPGVPSGSRPNADASKFLAPDGTIYDANGKAIGKE